MKYGIGTTHLWAEIHEGYVLLGECICNIHLWRPHAGGGGLFIYPLGKEFDKGFIFVRFVLGSLAHNEKAEMNGASRSLMAMRAS